MGSNLSHSLRERIARVASRIADTAPPTVRGWMIAGLCGLGLWHWGFGSMDLVVFVFGVSGLALFLLSGFLIGISALRLQKASAGSSRSLATLEAGTPLDTGFRLPAFARVPLVKVEWQWLLPEGVECRQILDEPSATLREVALARRRCQVLAVRRRFTVRGAFGLSRVAWQKDEPAPLTILPEVGKLRSMEVMQSISSSEGLPHPSGEPEGDRMDLRRYVPGDSMRHILWKTYARTRTLNVRTPERSVDRSRRTVAYLLTGPGDEPAAAAARVALERGLLGERWVFGADGGSRPVEDLRPALDAIARSGSWHRPDDAPAGDGLRRFLADPLVAGERHCVVFAPGHGGARRPRSASWAGDVLAALAGAGFAATFVLGIDGVVRRGPQPLWQRLLYVDEPQDESITSEELDALLREVSAAGRGGVVVVDRATGKSHGHQQLLRAKAS